MNPESKARQQIDRKLEQAGWVIQDLKQFNPGVAPGVVVREYPTDTGPADYVLFVNRDPVGVIDVLSIETASRNNRFHHRRVVSDGNGLQFQHSFGDGAYRLKECVVVFHVSS